MTDAIAAAARRFATPLAAADPEAFAAAAGELRRQRDGIELIASENLVSRAVLEAQGSVFTNKTVEGSAGARYYGGAEFADAAESLAIARAKTLFGCAFANVQCHSGSNANAAVFLATLKEGECMLAMDLAAGGHVSHGHPATSAGKRYRIVHYGVSSDSGLIEIDEVARLARESRPKLIVAGGSAYPRALDFAAFRAIADEVGARFMVDMAHFAGLVATGLHADPFPHAHVVTSTTYKSLRGARGGLILWNDPGLSRKIEGGVFPGVQGSVIMHEVLAKAVCFGEALQPEFADYQRAAVANAQALAEGLSARGLKLLTGGTDTTLMLLDLRPTGVTGATASEALERAGIAVNKNVIPFDPLPAEEASGLRLSSNAGTARGLDAAGFARIAELIADVIAACAANSAGDAQVEARVGREVHDLCAALPIYDAP